MTIRLIAEELSCRRGSRMLFERVSFALEPGEALLIRGPNGAGKSSLLRILAGFLAPTAGDAWIETDDEQAGQQDLTHFLGHRDGVKAALTLREAAEFDQAALGGDGSIDKALEEVGLDRLGDLPCGVLSTGQRRRLALARLLSCWRPLWLLDEPTTALDAGGRILLDGMIAEHRRQGGVVVAATHLSMDTPAARRLRLGERP